MMTWSKGSAIKQHIKLCDADGKGVDCPTVNCRKCRYDNDIEGREAIITKDDLIRTNEAYWDVINRAREALKKENPDKEAIDVDEIHVDPEEDYVFVSWQYYDEENDGRWCETSTTYRINKFLSLINRDAEVDPNDKIQVELKGVRNGRKGH